MPDKYAAKYAIFRFPDRAEVPAGQVVGYQSVSEFPGWDRAREWVLGVIQKFGVKRILEVGSGANPTLDPADVAALGLDYTANDVSGEELTKADDAFDRWVCDLSTGSVPAEREGSFDLIFSRMVNEHVSDGRTYHANIHKLLKPGGVSAHCFSTLYCFPFTVNRLAPEFLSSLLLNLFMPRDAHKLGKFKAYYSWSRGPSRAMLRRFESLGYEVMEYRGYFGHAYYARVPPLHWLESRKARWLLGHPVPELCSYGTVILKKR
jgi:2-polyprenyl-3-methyl-5-hydroxy-6-metoxy-1,4-benzoquinol methylase